MNPRSFVPLFVAGLLIVGGGAGTASAHETKIAVNGGAVAHSPHGGLCSSNHGRVSIKDLSADGFSVRADYYRGSSGPYSVVERRGKGHIFWSSCGTPITKIRACVVRPIISDQCTSWRS